MQDLVSAVRRFRAVLTAVDEQVVVPIAEGDLLLSADRRGRAARGLRRLASAADALATALESGQQ